MTSGKVAAVALIPPLAVALGVRFTVFGPETDPVEAWKCFWAILIGGGFWWAYVVVCAVTIEDQS